MALKIRTAQRLQHDVGRAVPEWVFVLVDDPTPAFDGQAFGGNRRARDVAAQAFQAAALVRLADRGGVERKARQLGQQHVVGCILSWRHAVQGQGLTAGVRSDGDASPETSDQSCPNVTDNLTFADR